MGRLLVLLHLPVVLLLLLRCCHAGGEICKAHASSGCFNDQPRNGHGACPPNGGPCPARCLPYFIANKAEAGITREGCACLCHHHGFALAGVENGNNCFW